MASVWEIALGFAPDGFEIVKACDEECTKKLELGDLFMVKCASSFDGSGLGYYHAGVYCSEEDEEIIHFTFSSSSSGSCNSSYGKGVVSKVSMQRFCEQDKYAIYRKNGGIPASFRAKIKEAMNERKVYNLLDYNCIHFALKLLDVDPKIIDDYIKKFLKYFNNPSRKEGEMEPFPV